MMKIELHPVIAITATLLVAPAQAHSPSEHITKSEKPNCEAFAQMDHSSMTGDNPVIAAMIKKCMGYKDSEINHASDSEGQAEFQDVNTPKSDHTDSSH